MLRAMHFLLGILVGFVGGLIIGIAAALLRVGKAWGRASGWE